MTSRKLNEPQLKELRELLDVCDDLRKIFGSMGQTHSLTIPEIVVVGNQSVGKSSLLELLSGFRLPSGTGIVTRCPIVLQIRRGPRERYEVENQEVSLQSFASALFAAQNRLVSIECAEIRSSSEVGVDVTAKSVTTRIEGPTNRNITLVDLPGIQYSNTKLTGKIKEIIKEYIKNPSAIILLVTQCSSDPTATEALQCAREADPHQERTVCVLTKPDELRIDDEPKMKSLVDLVEGRHTNLNFPKGVFITKARGGSEDERSLEEIREIETKFFERHPYFKSCYSQLKQAGYENLMDRMEQLSLNSMRASLPKMKDDVRRELESRESQVEKIDMGQIIDDDNTKRLILTGLFSNVITKLKQNYESEYGKNLGDSLERFEIRIVAITKRSAANLEDDLSEYLTKRDPLRPSGVINQWAVDQYCSEFIEKLKAPATELFEAIHEIVHTSMLDAIEKEVDRQMVKNAIVAVSEMFMRQFKKEVNTKLKESFEFEDLYYFSQLARFYGPTVQMMKNLDDDFTFSGQIMPSKINSQLEASGSHMMTQSSESLNIVNNAPETAGKKMTWKKGGNTSSKNDKPPSMYLTGPLSAFDQAEENASKGKEMDESVFSTPGVNKNFLKSFLKLMKGSPTANTRIVIEADTLVNEQETLHQKLETHFFYTGYRVAGNVGKLLMYHFRKKMPEDLKYKLDSSVMDLSESLNPDPDMLKELNETKEDIQQLELAQQKITAAMKACKA